MKSLIEDMEHCYVCGRTGHLEVHHCFHGTANRKLAEEDGMVIALCPLCHRGSNGVHNNKALDIRIQAEAQRVWMIRYHGTVDDFRKRYGKNYMEDET